MQVITLSCVTRRPDFVWRAAELELLFWVRNVNDGNSLAVKIQFIVSVSSKYKFLSLGTCSGASA